MRFLSRPICCWNSSGIAGALAPTYAADALAPAYCAPAVSSCALTSALALALCTFLTLICTLLLLLALDWSSFFCFFLGVFPCAVERLFFLYLIGRRGRRRERWGARFEMGRGEGER